MNTTIVRRSEDPDNITIRNISKQFTRMDETMHTVPENIFMNIIGGRKSFFSRVPFRASVPGLPGPYQAPFVFTQILTFL